MFGFEKARGPYFGEEWVAKKRVAKGGRSHNKKIGKRSQNLLWNSLDDATAKGDATPGLSSHHSDHNNSGEEWNIVKGKHGGSRSTSPSVDRTRPAPTGSPKEKAPTEKSIPNRFSSLSNLEGDSSASVEDIAHTTERVMGSGAIPIENYNSTTDTSQEKTQVSILQLDKGTLPKMASKLTPTSSGIIIKEKSGFKGRSS
ncbi:hypothetical protein MRB53_030554 [Persea americana]|uniref:Uncharacterized protein n=1 Tax=Persea americana TaxID=3435 RepID=A0ACC2KLL8_PERAE|nr:hypothetical protein MRB53_030554 [Persea americana]